MRLSDLALNRRRFTVMALAALVGNGLLGLWLMPRSEDPIIEMKECSVIITYPGASPADLEDLIVDPVEERLIGMEETEKLDSWAMDGAAYFYVEFFDDVDVDDAIQTVNNEISEAKKDLPPGVLNTEVIRHSTDRVVVLQAAVAGEDYTHRQLFDYAEIAKNELRRISGVKKVEIEGAQEQEIRVSLDIDKLAAWKLSPLTVAERVAAANIGFPAGKVEIPGRKFNVTLGGDFETLEDVKSAIVEVRAGMPLRLEDIADVRLAYKDSTYWVRYNGQRAVFITATQKEGSNLLSVGKKMRTALEKLEGRFPADLKLEIVFDQSDFVSRRLNSFAANLLYGGAFVAVAVFLLVGGRLAIVILLAIPLSVIVGLGGVYRLGYQFEQISISAMILSLGMLVDNAIVISENIQRHLNLGLSRWEAAGQGAREVAGAVTSATATTIAAFFPILAMAGSSGQFIRSMPVTVMMTIAASLLVALTATPLISAAVLKPTAGGEHMFARGLHRLGEKYYPVILRAVLKRPGLAVVITLGALMGSMALFTTLGKEFFPKANKPLFIIDIYRPKGANLTSVDEIVRRMEEEILKAPGVARIAANVGKGNPVVYYNLGRERETDHYGQLMVMMEPEIEYEKVSSLIKKLREEWEDYPEARIEVQELAQGPPVGAPVSVRIGGDDLETLRKLSYRVEGILRETAGTDNIRNELRGGGGEIRVEVDRDRAGMLGIPQAAVARILRMALAGEPVTSFRLGGEEREVTLRLPFEQPPGWDAFSRIYFPAAGGRGFVPLSEVAKPVISGGPSVIAHRDGERNFRVRCDVLEGYFAWEIAQSLRLELDKIAWPEGYTCSIEGETEERDESFASLFNAAIIAILVIYAILVLQFNSFSQPLVIFTALPLAFIGAVLGLFVTGNNFGFMAFVGIESLIGIVINDAIVLLDFVNSGLKKGLSRDEALIQAGSIRFTPILLTSITTIGG